MSTETPIHCLAIRAYRRCGGEIDSLELEDFLDQTAGPNTWFMTSVWMFSRAPLVMRPGFSSVPVIVPEDVAGRLNLIECEDRRTQRIYEEHVVGAVELRGWRWVAAQVFPRSDGMGVFPWEKVAIEGRVLHG